MEHSTQQLCAALLKARDEQIENLRRKGVEISDGETLNGIGDKMLTIYDTGGLAYGEWVPLFNTDTFTVSGLNAKPTSLGLSCEAVITDRLTEAGNIFIALFNYDTAKEQVTFYKYLDDSTFVFDKISTDLVCTVEQAQDGTYTVTVSFAELNEMTVKPYLFKGGYEYNWVASSKAWFL